MKSRRYAVCAILAGVLAYGIFDVGCDDNTGTPRGPFPLPDAGAIGSNRGSGFDGGQPRDAPAFDAVNPPPQDGGFPADGGF